MRRISLIRKISAVSLLTILVSCSIDDRFDELTASYSGVIIDSDTGQPVYTEYYGTSVKLADLAGDVNQPLSFNISPDGTFSNDYVFPSEYKVYAEGPFFRCDTLIGNFGPGTDIRLEVTPNVRLEINDYKIESGIALTVNYSYSIVDPNSDSGEIGLIYGDRQYPGQREVTSGEKELVAVSELEGKISQTLYLNENSTYYIRALGHSEDAGDYWNYSDQICVKTGNVDISNLDIAVSQNSISATSTVIDWSFPPIVDAVRVKYTDNSGEEVERTIPVGSKAWLANLPSDCTVSVTANLMRGDVMGPDRQFNVVTEPMTAVYMDDNDDPYWNDTDMKYSFSKYFAELWAPVLDPSWTTSTFRHEFLDWWRSTGIVPNHDNLPLNSEMSEITEISVYGNITSLLDLLPCANLEVLHILAGEDLFSAGLAISPDTDLSPLTALKKLDTIYLGKEIPLTEEDFRRAGIGPDVQIIQEP